MCVSLYHHLQDKQHSQDFVADTLVAGLDFAGKDIAQADEALGELVVGACEVEGGEAEGVEEGGRGEGVEVLEEVLLDLCGLWCGLSASRGRRGATLVGFADGKLEFGA